MKKKRLVAFVAVIAILVSCFGSISAYANDFDNAETAKTGDLAGIMRYTALVSIGNSLKLNSGGRLTCISSTQTQLAYNAGVKMELQVSDGGWRTIKTWDEAATDSEYLRLSKDWYVDYGTYRLKLTHTALNKNGTAKETVTDYSDTVVYKK